MLAFRNFITKKNLRYLKFKRIHKNLEVVLENSEDYWGDKVDKDIYKQVFSSILNIFLEISDFGELFLKLKNLINKVSIYKEFTDLLI